MAARGGARRASAEGRRRRRRPAPCTFAPIRARLPRPQRDLLLDLLAHLVDRDRCLQRVAARHGEVLDLDGPGRRPAQPAELQAVGAGVPDELPVLELEPVAAPARAA